MTRKDLKLTAKLSGKPISIYAITLQERTTNKIFKFNIKSVWFRVFLTKKEVNEAIKELKTRDREWHRYRLKVVELELWLGD